ncbi:Hypothetical predicted protein [Pelobates cultripes]|uniref:Uncharacterized protein n=1 Tax=Pelobates cultripes TaxID=61616 RepID=A0AAD1W224_PELCU|nr:Hypothetical predicted protein [Pelobates cultripes]
MSGEGTKEETELETREQPVDTVETCIAEIKYALQEDKHAINAQTKGHFAKMYNRGTSYMEQQPRPVYSIDEMDNSDNDTGTSQIYLAFVQDTKYSADGDGAQVNCIPGDIYRKFFCNECQLETRRLPKLNGIWRRGPRCYWTVSYKVRI